MKRCDKCGCRKGSTRYDPGTQRILCDRCWFETEPKHRLWERTERPPEATG